jgi:hypothetical protein
MICVPTMPDAAAKTDMHSITFLGEGLCDRGPRRTPARNHSYVAGAHNSILSGLRGYSTMREVALHDGKYLQWNSETGDIWLIDPEERKPCLILPFTAALVAS